MRRFAYGGRDDGQEDHLSHEMGMHTEGLLGRTQQRFFDISEENVGYGYPDAPDVDFNKRAEIDCEGPANPSRSTSSFAT